MNVRLILSAVIAAAIAFAGYQAYLITRPTAAAPLPAAASPPASAAAAPLKATDAQPLGVQAAQQHVAGVDSPFDRNVARRITVEQVKARLDKGQRIVYVDTRAEIPDVMIKGAVQVPESNVDAWAKGVSKRTFVVTYCTCADEATSAREVLALQKLGFTNAFALVDGLFGWQSYDLPTQQPPHPASSY